MADEHGTPRHIRQRCVTERAAKQWGNVTTAQLRGCGVSPRTLQRWLHEGRLVRVLRAVYSLGHRSPAPEAFWAAVLLGYGEDTVLTRHTALALHGLGPAPRVATVATPKQARSQHRVTAHSSMPFERDEVVIRRGLRTTSIERTLLDLAALGEPVERLVAEAVAKRLTSIAKLRAYVERRSGARGAARLRRCIEGRQTRSGLEREFAAWLEARRIPAPQFNEPFGPYTLDAVWPAAGLVVELDAFETHGTRQSFEDDRRRDAYVMERGRRTLRITPNRWRHDGARLERQLRRQLAADLGE